LFFENILKLHRANLDWIFQNNSHGWATKKFFGSRSS